MSVVSDPTGKYPYILESDREKDLEQCPIFFLQIWTFREYRAQLETITALSDGSGNDEVFDAAISLIGSSLVNWKNLRNRSGDLVPFNAAVKDPIVDMVNVNELMELAFAVVNQEPDAETKKKLSSPSPSEPADADKQTVEDSQTADGQ
jgi:hypothetical protein